jgi:hypothetical protein
MNALGVVVGSEFIELSRPVGTIAAISSAAGPLGPGLPTGSGGREQSPVLVIDPARTPLGRRSLAKVRADGSPEP